MIEHGFDQIEAIGLVTEVLATRGIDHTAAKRRQWDREYRRKRRQERPPDTPDIHPTSTRQNGTYVEVPYVKSMDVEEKGLPEKQVTLNQVPVSRARARKKPAVEFPEVWPTQEVIDAGLRLLPLESVMEECEAMRNWALSKDERRVNWLAFAKNWFKTAAKKHKSSFVAKPLSQRKTIHDRADELLAAAATSLSQDRSQTGCKLVGGPVEIISTDYRHILVAGTDESLGGDLLPVSGKRPEGDLLPDDRDGYQF